MLAFIHCFCIYSLWSLKNKMIFRMLLLYFAKHEGKILNIKKFDIVLKCFNVQPQEVEEGFIAVTDIQMEQKKLGSSYSFSFFLLESKYVCVGISLLLANVCGCIQNQKFKKFPKFLSWLHGWPTPTQLHVRESDVIRTWPRERFRWQQCAKILTT